jgi:hypothetical protein
LIADFEFDYLIADKGYDSQLFVESFRETERSCSHSVAQMESLQARSWLASLPETPSN